MVHAYSQSRRLVFALPIGQDLATEPTSLLLLCGHHLPCVGIGALRSCDWLCLFSLLY